MQAFPLKNEETINSMSEYLFNHYHPKLYVLWLTGLNTGLRVSDILKLKWSDIFSKDGDFLYYTYQRATKTKKRNHIYTSEKLRSLYRQLRELCPNDVYVFQSNAFTFRNLADGSKRTTRSEHPIMYKRQIKAMREVPRPFTYPYVNGVLKETAKALELKVPISTHTMRKSFAYINVFLKGCPLSVISEILQHANLTVTKRYLCIEEDEKKNILTTSDIGFLPNVMIGDVTSDVVPKLKSIDMSKQHLDSISTVVSSLMVNPEMKNFYVQNLSQVFATIWIDVKNRDDYAARIIEAAFYLAKRAGRDNEKE